MLHRPWLWFAWLIALFTVQVVLTPALLPSGIRPDWMLVFVSLLGFVAGPAYGLAVGGLAGLLLDIVTGRFIGLHTLLKGAIGWAAGQVTRHVYREHAGLALLTVAVAAAVQEVIALGLLRAFGLAFPLSFLGQRLPLIISLDLVLAALLYPVLLRQATAGRTPGMRGEPR